MRLTGQMLWLEHFWLLARTTADFDNERCPLCRDIPWASDASSDAHLAAYSEARTGYPWVNALVTQLRTEGFVTQLGRHSLVCFLTLGYFWVSWTRCAAVFDEILLDFGYALNAANWMWLSCSAVFSTYFRMYSPIAFAREWDKNGGFNRHYFPTLRRMPDKYIHEPWRAPRSVQIAAGCVIGKDCPEPVVEHATVYQQNEDRAHAERSEESRACKSQPRS